MSLEGKQLDHYRILHLIGRGGMGEVYLAEDSQVHRQVAIKVIKIESAQSDEEVIAKTLRLFLREATAVARLDHPNILPLYDYGQETIDATPFAYLIIPYRAEGSLMNWLRKQAKTQKTKELTLKQVDHLIQQASKALQYAHDHQIIHQDVKPANFLIRSTSDGDEYPDLQLSDFGIARLASATSSVSQNVRGTPRYMAPEQWDGKPVFASDQYALAVMAYELLAGHPPFQGTPMNMMYSHLQKIPQPLRELKPLLPPTLDTVLLHALAKKPEERFSSVAAFARAFQEAIPNSDEGTKQRGLQPSPSMPQTLDKQGTADMRATLAISPEEARHGALRVLTLSNGRPVSIQIPPGARSGQMLTLASQGETLGPGSPAGNLYLTLSIVEVQPQFSKLVGENIPTYYNPRPSQPIASAQPAQQPTAPAEPVLPSQQKFVQPTVLPTQQTPPPQASSTSPSAVSKPPAPLSSASHVLPIPAQPRRLSPTVTALLAFVLLFTLGGGVIGFALLGRHGANSNLTSNSGQVTNTVIKVATDLPISGGEVDIGTTTMNGATLAVDQANTNHTIPNVTLQLIKKDDTGVAGVPDLPTGAANIESLLGDPQVAGAIGPFNSAVARAEMPVANNGNIALISPSNTNPCLTKEGDAVGCGGANDIVKTLRPTGNVTYFRLAATDDHQGPAMADYLYKTLHLKTAYVVDDTTTYGAGLAKYFVQEWQALGGTITAAQSVAKTTDYTNLLTAAVAKKPDVLYFGGDYDTGGQIIQKQMTTIQGLTKTVFAGGDGLTGSPDFYKQITDDGGQAYMTVASPDPAKIPAAVQFIRDYTARYGAVGPYSAMAFDAMNILIQAIKKALTTTSAARDANDTIGGNAFRTAVLSALKQTDYNGVTGHTSFDANGDTTNKVFSLYKVALVGDTPSLETETVITVQ